MNFFLSGTKVELRGGSPVFRTRLLACQTLQILGGRLGLEPRAT
ncbi:MAG: hypothetical protein ACJ0DI_08805 [bacterium]